MKKGLTHIIFVIDRSGSMSSIASDMIGGFNSFITKQKELPDECRVTLVQFDTEYEELLRGVPLLEVKELTNKTFVPRGCTALYDAVGKSINSVGQVFSDMPEDERPEKVLFVTITDGLENSSQEFTAEKVREMIEHQTNVYKWEFVYIGANQNSWDVGQSMGISGNKTINYVSVGSMKSSSTKALWTTLGEKTTKYRSASVDAVTSFDFTPEEQEQQNKMVKVNTV